MERGEVHPVSWELMGEGRKLADQLGVELAGVVMGPPGGSVTAAAAECFAYGADVADVLEDPVLTDYRNDFTRAFTHIVNTYKPRSCCWARRRSAAILRALSRRRF